MYARPGHLRLSAILKNFKTGIFFLLRLCIVSIPLPETIYDHIYNNYQMQQVPDQAVSEVIGTILMVAMVVMIAGITAALVLGMPFVPQKPTLSGFTVEIIQVANGTLPGSQTVPVISFYQVSGDKLAFFGPNGTNIRLTDPGGNTRSVNFSGTGSEIRIGERFLVFRESGSPGNYLVTNNHSSIPGIEPFTPHGTWRFIITDEKETNMVIFDKDLTL